MLRLVYAESITMSLITQQGQVHVGYLRVRDRRDDLAGYLRLGDASLHQHMVKYTKRKLSSLAILPGLRRNVDQES